MKTTKILTIAAMTLMVSACSSNDIELTAQQPDTQTEGIPFIATISIGESATTRALSESGSAIVPSWAEGEKVALIHDGKNDEMTVSSVSNGVATITGTITGSPANSASVTIIYPSSAADGTTGNVKANLLAAQDGTLATIAEKYDVRTGTGTLNVGATASLYGNVSLTNQNAIVKFSLSDGTDALAATQFLIKDGNNDVLTTVTPASATSTLYVAMAPATTSVFRFEASSGSSTYTYTKSSATFAAGKYYQSPMALNDMLHTPLTFEAIEDGTIHVTIPQEVELENPIVYTKNGVDVDNPDGTADYDITVAAGDIISFHSANAALGKVVRGSYKHPTIKPTNRCYIYGNVMSLIDDAGDFTTDKDITGDYALYGLFLGAKMLENHPTKELILPATTLTNYCYSDLFSGCSALTKAPDLPATELKLRCYEQMFWECTSLTEASVMSATTVASYCCHDMFNGCTNLVKVPNLLSKTLAEYCYNGMFHGCSSLNYVKCLATDVSATDCLGGWIENVSATGTLVVASGATWAVAGTNGIPSGWTVTTE